MYVVPAIHDGNKIIKIGFTTKASVNTRLNEINSKCRGTIQFLRPSESSPEHHQVKLFYEQVERLAHTELANFCYSFDCSCKTKHREFFGVGEEIGHMVVARWARFCKLQPFTSDFELKEEWKFHLDRFRERNHGRDGEELEKMDGHNKRNQRWETFLKSKRSRWHMHRVGVLGTKTWAYRWQLWSLCVASSPVVCKLWWWPFILLLVTAMLVFKDKPARDLAADWAGWLRDVVVTVWRVATHYASPGSTRIEN